MIRHNVAVVIFCQNKISKNNIYKKDKSNLSQYLNLESLFEYCQQICTNKKMFSIKLKLSPSLNGIKFILGLNNDSPNCDNLENSLKVGIPTIFPKSKHE